jgi:hypothetical protein
MGCHQEYPSVAKGLTMSTTTAHAQTVSTADAHVDRGAVLNRRRLTDLLVTAEARDADREWMNLTPGMYSLLAWVEPLAILREIALQATHSHSEKGCLCLAS